MPRLSKIGAAALAAFGWTTGAAPVPADFLVIAGGGGGGFNAAGGGGAGGYRTSAGTSGGGASAEAKLNLNPTQSYTVTVGAGGAGGLTGSRVGGNGGDSVFSTVTSTGGGGGGASTQYNGNSGGSGGGGLDSGSGGSGTANQGYAGGGGNTGFPYNSGGGGGAGEAGNTDGQSYGGDGVASSITGTSVTRAGGGGGGRGSGSGSNYPGGDGGGGDGGGAADVIGGTGSVNTGSGGGGGGHNGSNGGNGGSGVVIISYVGAQQFGGGVVTSSGGNTIHTFTTSGTLSPLSSLTANYLIVAGGGGGGTAFGAGGGAGGLRSTVTNTGGGGSLESALRIDTNSIYLVTVGAGGAGAIGSTLANGANGSNSSFLNITSIGGGTGGNNGAAGSSGGSGGAGGNQGSISAAAGAGTANQGFAGGTGSGNSSFGSGGGGGAGAIGGTGTTSVCGDGGAGVTVDITGSSVAYAGGGGGGATSVFGITTPGNGGNGGGGKGADSTNSWVGYSGSANTGGGGGGGGYTGSWQNAGAGGSGVVIISYPGSTPQMAGGTVTVAGGNVIHTFTSSGYLSPITNVNNSLRFRASASAYLNRTPTTNGSGTTFTWSGWIKRGILGGSNYMVMYSAGSGDAALGALFFDTTDHLYFLNYNGGYNWQLITTAVYRDPSAWYHVVAVVDTTQITTSNRIRLYVNGVEITAFSTASYPTQNYSSPFFNQTSYTQLIGRWGTWSSSHIFDGYMADINFVDGQALTPFSFGSFNGLGVWQPIRYGGSYGTNGFYLPFNAGTSSFAGLFNGSSQYLSTTSGITNQFTPTSGFTLEMWLNPSNTNTAQVFYVGGGSNSWSATNGYLFGLLLGSGGNYQWQWNNAGATFTLSFPDLSTNRWSHVAIGYNGTTTRIWVNGVSAGTSTNPYTVPTTVNQYVIGSSFGGAANFYSGQLSNLRFVKGTDVYGVANANISVPTSPLTAIANTQLLTLQNSTIIDNSTNAFSITNNGTVTTGQTYPCSTAIFNDQGPAGNNWTPNNISGAFGSTLDYMTDVPTLTSATTANYCTLNPIIPIPRGTIAQGNLNYLSGSTSTHGSVAATFTLPTTGKWYWEVTACNNSGGSGNNEAIGVANILNNPQLPAAGSEIGSGSRGDYAYRSDGNKYSNGNQGAYGATYTNGDVIGVAWDSDSGTITFYKNNASQGTAFSSITQVAGKFAPASSNAETSNGDNYNFGQRPFAYTPPTGFVALNTFNLSTPTIGATPATTANKYFDATTYAGNNGTQSVTNSGSMQPDFVWVKNRTNAYTHLLYDSVRGVGTLKAISSSETTVEGGMNDNSTFGYLSALNSNGFTVVSGSTANSYTNSSSNNYIGWQWKANGSGSTNTAGSIISTVSVNTTAGFSIVTYTGNGTSASTVGHGLLVGGVATAPSMVILKSRTLTTAWYVYHSGLTSAAYQIYLNLPNQEDNSVTTAFNSVAPGATTFTLPGTGFGSNNSGATYVAYCFAQVAGYSAFGSYTGNGSGTGDGPFIYTGFRPRFVLVKRKDSTSTWGIIDTARDTYNVTTKLLFPNTPDQENTSYTPEDILSNGFKLRDTTYNIGSGTYIYMAFAESPFKYANAR